MGEAARTRSTDAGAQQQGFRLQKLRAVMLLLSRLQSDRDAAVAVAIEYDADVRLEDGDHVHRGETKLYESKKSFTLASIEVRNTLANFLDIYTSDEAPREHSSYGFYTNISLGREEHRGGLAELGLKIPDETGLLQALVSRKHLDAALPTIRTYLLHSFCEILCKDSRRAETSPDAKDPPRCSSPCIAAKAWHDSDWKRFFDKIDWGFDQPDNEQLEEDLQKAIRQHHEYDAALKGREEEILHVLLDKLDRSQGKPTRTQRLLFARDVDNVFLRASKRSLLGVDEGAVAALGNLPAPEDPRGVREKIEDQLGRQTGKGKRLVAREELAASAGAARREQGGDEYVASLYVVYQATSKCLDQHAGGFTCPSAIDEFFDTCADAAFAAMTERQKTYSYTIADKQTLREMTAFLFDSCYFDFQDQ